MGKLQTILSNLQESVQYTFEEICSEENKKNSDKVEMLQDKFDALLQIIETQAHRVCCENIAINRSNKADDNAAMCCISLRMYNVCFRFRIWVLSSL